MVILDQSNSEIRLSNSTKELVIKFITDLENSHLNPDIEKIKSFYSPNVCAIEINSIFLGRDSVVEGLPYLFKYVDFLEFHGELKSASESGNIVWLYVHYQKTKMRSKDTNQEWEAKNSRCSYVLEKYESKLLILQSHCSMPMNFL